MTAIAGNYVDIHPNTSEVACEHGGYLEGAIESADEALSIISR